MRSSASNNGGLRATLKARKRHSSRSERRRPTAQPDAGQLWTAPGRCDHRGVGRILRRVFGEYRAPTGAPGQSAVARQTTLADFSVRLPKPVRQLGARLRFLVGKPGLDGHSATALSRLLSAHATAGFEVIYQGIRRYARTNRGRSGRGGRSCRGPVDSVRITQELVPEVVQGLRAAGLDRRAGGRRRDHP